jgi:hypothetical protein
MFSMICFYWEFLFYNHLFSSSEWWLFHHVKYNSLSKIFSSSVLLPFVLLLSSGFYLSTLVFFFKLHLFSLLLQYLVYNYFLYLYFLHFSTCIPYISVLVLHTFQYYTVLLVFSVFYSILSCCTIFISVLIFALFLVCTFSFYIKVITV